MVADLAWVGILGLHPDFVRIDHQKQYIYWGSSFSVSGGPCLVLPGVVAGGQFDGGDRLSGRCH